MCNSFNHDPSCTCGFGGDGHSGSSYGSSRYSGFRPLTSVNFESFIYPTNCPVCGASVFFYRSPYDGRVFFDDLSPTWSKHPCTDSSNKSISSAQSIDNYTPTKFLTNLRPHFKEGWDLFLVDSIYTQHDALAKMLELPSEMGQICRGRAITIHKKRGVKLIKKATKSSDSNSDSNTDYTYRYTINTLELEIKEKAPFLQAGKFAYISQDLSEDMYLELSTFEIDKKTSAIKNRLIKARLIKFRNY